MDKLSDNLNQLFADLAKQARKEKNLIQEDVADACYFSRASMVNIEAGRGVSFLGAIRMAKLLGIDLNALRDRADILDPKTFKRRRIVAKIAKLESELEENPDAKSP